jgi:hypothetical protein
MLFDYIKKGETISTCQVHEIELSELISAQIEGHEQETCNPLQKK